LRGRIVGIALAPSAILGLACFILHALANGRYGFFRDELYFIVCGGRPDWGYVDQPAVVPLLASWMYGIFGDNLWGFRLLRALVMSATVAATAGFVWAVGGGRFAQWLAGLCVLLAPFLLLDGVLFYTEMFQPLTWLGLAWVLVRLEQTGDERWWLAFGIIAGFSLNTKYMVAFQIVGMGIGALATPLRASLTRPWLWLGAGIAGIMVLPNVLWQQAHGWPFLELGKAAGGKNLMLSPVQFLIEQLLLIGPLAAPVWLTGLWTGAGKQKLATARVLAIAWIILFLFFDLTHGKAYYLASAYPALLALGAGRIEGWVRAPAARGAALSVVGLAGLVTAPLTLPILPVEAFVRYQHVLGFTPSVGEKGKVGPLPQYYGDMFGWPQMAAKVAEIYRALPPQDRAKAVFFGDNYGEAAAIDVFGRRLGLPPAITGHNQYFLWGPRGHDGSVMIIVGGRREHYDAIFTSVQVVRRTDSPYAMPYEAGAPIYVLRGLKTPLPAFWPRVKNYR
jgi:hypothetical protein